MNEQVQKLANFMPNFQVLTEDLQKLELELGSLQDPNSILQLVPFVTAMRTLAEKLEKFEENFSASKLPTEIRFRYTELRDIIYRIGKFERGGFNRARNESPVTAESLWLGDGVHWEKNVKWIIEKWPSYLLHQPEIAHAYSLKATDKLKPRFVVMTLIQKLQKEIEKAHSNT